MRIMSQAHNDLAARLAAANAAISPEDNEASMLREGIKPGEAVWLLHTGAPLAEVMAAFEREFAAMQARSDREFAEWLARYEAMTPQQKAAKFGGTVEEYLAEDAAAERERILDALVDAERTRQAGHNEPEPKHPVEPIPGLRTPREAAARLRCSLKTLNAHVESGALRYVLVGRGTRRQHRMFTDADLDAFIASQTRVAAPPCSTKSRTPLTGTSTSSCDVIAFTARPRRRPDGKRKP
jgi:hypothetical protein